MPNGAALLVSVKLDRSRKLRFDFNALAVLEENGVNVFDDAVLADIDRLLRSPSKLRLLTWAGLLHEDPELTQQDVGALLIGDAVVPTISAVADALKQSLGEQESEGNAPAAAAKASRRGGKTSGP